MRKLNKLAKILAVLFLVPSAGIAMYLYVAKTNGEITVAGETRGYLLYIPESYDPARPTSLVISLHGAYLSPGMQNRLTRWNNLADEQGFIVVYPKASGYPRLWQVAPGESRDREVRFFANLIQHLLDLYNIDPARVYVNGFSNGAAATIMLSCHLADRIAAFGMVAVPSLPQAWCTLPRPAPAIIFQGTVDPYVPYAGGTNFLTDQSLPGIPAWTAQWGKRNHCRTETDITMPATGVNLHRHEDCANNAKVSLYTLEGAGHIWPGGKRLPAFGVGRHHDALDATREMWSFFQAHPLDQDMPRAQGVE